MNITNHKCAFAALAALALVVPAFAESLVSYTGTFTETDHPTIAGAHVVTMTSHGTLTVPADVRLLRLLVVGGGGGGGLGGGAGGQVVDWTPETPTFLKTDDAYQVVVGPCGYRSNQGSQQARGHNGFPSSVSCSAFEVVALGGGGARGWGYSNDSRWDVESPQTWGNGGGGACDQQAATLIGYEAGAEGCFPGGNATNSGSSGTGCGGGGGGAGADGPGGDSQVLHTSKNNDAYQDENGNYEHAGDGGPGVVSDITGTAISYGDGGGGGVRRSNFKHGGAGGLGGGGRGAGLYEGSVTDATAAAPNRGGGGGGGGWNATGTTLHSAGGADGVVILLVAPPAAGEESADRESPWAVGGTVSTWRDPELRRNWVVHEFRGSGELVVKHGFDAELLLVGGGGAGGAGSGAGGGAGGLVHTNGIHLAVGVYDVIIGAGGVVDGDDGGASSLVSQNGRVSLVAPGGGAGGGYKGGSSRYAGHVGGSGGGSQGGDQGRKLGGMAEPGDGVVIGHAGGDSAASGYNSGGGGGAGSAGTSATAGSDTTCLGNGGDGLAFDITGELRFYAGGGGAGWSGSANGRGNHGVGGSGVGGDGEISLQSTTYRRPWGHPGRDGTGSGGGGGGQTSGVGGKGGCGVLIVRYLASPPSSTIFIR